MTAMHDDVTVVHADAPIDHGARAHTATVATADIGTHAGAAFARVGAAFGGPRLRRAFGRSLRGTLSRAFDRAAGRTARRTLALRRGAAIAALRAAALHCSGAA